MEIYIVRHGETLWNRDKRLQGNTNIELSDYGRELAIKTGQALSDTRIDKIFSSPLVRAYETADLIRNKRNIEIITDQRIKELSFGRFEGCNFSELIADESLTFKYFFKQPHLYIPDETGETLEHLIERAANFMTEVIEPLENECERVMIVAHGALNKAIMSYVKKHPTKDFWSGGLQENCNVIIIDYTDKHYTIIDETRLFYNKSDTSCLS